MSNTPSGYSIRLVYYGRADFMKWQKTGKKDADGFDERAYLPVAAPQTSTQNIRIVPFSYSAEDDDQIAIYELVKNAEAPKSDLEVGKV